MTLSSGLISSLRRNDKSELVLIQISAPISSGSSGGGLFDEQGRLIGITTLVATGTSGVAQNLNFAVPVEWVKELPTRHASLHSGVASAAASGATTAAASSVAAAPVATAGAATSIEDVTRLPYSNPRMIDRYRTFLAMPLSRAFAISESGWSKMIWGTKDQLSPSDRALKFCESESKNRCFLYAVDNSVVYDGKSLLPLAAQLPPGVIPTVDDTTQLPYANPRMVERYRVFLTWPSPRAFVISESGGWRMAAGRKAPASSPDAPVEPSERAMRNCETETKAHCFLYAVDNAVVYNRSAATAGK